jgi:hypothetical protein
LAILNRKVDDLCPLLQSATEPWYGFFSKFKKKDCPYPAGHVETFVKDKLVAPDFIPYNFIGKYRSKVKFIFTGHTDCVVLNFEVIDV